MVSASRCDQMAVCPLSAMEAAVPLVPECRTVSKSSAAFHPLEAKLPKGPSRNAMGTATPPNSSMCPSSSVRAPLGLVGVGFVTPAVRDLARVESKQGFYHREKRESQ